MELSHLLSGLIPVSSHQNRVINGLRSDSRQIQPGDLFFAVEGSQQHGGHFISTAILSKPAAILCDMAFAIPDSIEVAAVKAHIPLLKIPALSKQLGIIASRFYGDPSQKIPVIAVTGTNGKTSICHFVAQSMAHLAIRCGLLGTAGNGFPDALQPALLTTSDPISGQQALATLVADDAKIVALEASSHALDQYRLMGTQIKTAVFTNLTPEHLDYHKTMADYAASKERLFQWPSLEYAILNVDDPIGRDWCDRYHQQYPIIAYSSSNNCPDLPEPVLLLHGECHQSSIRGFVAKIRSPWGEATVHINLLGAFNLANLLATLGVLITEGIPFSEAIAAIQSVKGVPGRMQRYSIQKGPNVIVDFAHTPDALENALTSLQPHLNKGSLWCIFGCGGNRDRQKRPLMGEVAARYSDRIILTNDNPRYEEPEQIVNDIKQGIPATYLHLQVEMDRAIAIEYAIAHAKCDDIILIAGKGHESYQQIRDQRVFFSDQAIVTQCLRIRGIELS